MRHISLLSTFLILSSLIFLNACKKEAPGNISPAKNNTATPSLLDDSITVIDPGFIMFSTKESYANTLNYLYNQDMDFVDTWEASIGFSSLRTATYNDTDAYSCTLNDRYFESVLSTDYIVGVANEVFKIDPTDSFYYVLRDYENNSSYLSDLIGQHEVSGIIIKITCDSGYFEDDEDITGLFKTSASCNDQWANENTGRVGDKIAITLNNDTAVMGNNQYNRWGIWFSVRNLVWLYKHETNGDWTNIFPTGFKYGFEATYVAFTPVCQSSDYKAEGRSWGDKKYVETHSYYRTRRLKKGAQTVHYNFSWKRNSGGTAVTLGTYYDRFF